MHLKRCLTRWIEISNAESTRKQFLKWGWSTPGMRGRGREQQRKREKVSLGFVGLHRVTWHKQTAQTTRSRFTSGYYYYSQYVESMMFYDSCNMLIKRSLDLAISLGANNSFQYSTQSQRDSRVEQPWTVKTHEKNIDQILHQIWRRKEITFKTAYNAAASTKIHIPMPSHTPKTSTSNVCQIPCMLVLGPKRIEERKSET